MASNGDQLTADDSAASNTNSLLDLGFDDFTTPSTTVEQAVNNQDSLLDIGAGDFFTAQQPIQSSENNSSSLLDFFTSDNNQPPPQQQEDKVGTAGADDLLGFFSGSGTQAQSEDNNPPSSSDVFSNDSFDNLSASYGSAGISGGETDLFSLSDPTPNPAVNEAPAQLDLLGLEQNQSAGSLLQSDQGDLLFSSQSTEQHAEESSLGNFDSQVQLDQNDLLFSTQPGTDQNNEAVNTQETLVGDLLSSSDSQSQSNLLSAQPFVTSEQNLENLQEDFIGDTANNPDIQLDQSGLLFATQPSQDIEQTKQFDTQQESLIGDIQNSSDNQLQLDQSDLLFSTQPTEPESSQENLLEDLTNNSQNLLSAQPFVTPEPNKEFENVQEDLIGSITNHSDSQDQGDLLFVTQTSDQNTESEKQQVVGDLTNSSNLDPDQNNLLFSAHPAQTTEENHEVENSDTNLVGDLLSSSDSQSQPNLLSAQPFVTSEQNLENLQEDTANNPDIQLDQSDLLSTSQPAETTEPESSQENLLEDLTNNSQNLLSAQPFVTPEPNKEIENVQEDLVGDLLNNSDNQLQLDQSDLLFSTQASEQNTESEKQQENFVGDLTNSSSLESDQNNLLFSAQPIQTTEPDNQQDSLIENLANDSSFSESNQDNLLFSDQLISTTVDSNYPASNNTANQDLLGFFGGSTSEVLTEASAEQSVSTTTNTDNIFADFTSTSQEEASSNDLLNVSTSSDVKQNNNLNYDIFSTGGPSENAMNPEPSINPEDDTISTNQNMEPEDQQEDVVENVTNDSSLSESNQDGSDQLTGTAEENKTSENELDDDQESSEDQKVDEPISSEVTQQSSDEPNDCLSFSYADQVSNTEANQESNQESELNVQESSQNMILDESCYGASDSDDDSAPNNENSQIPRNMSPISMEFEENFYIGSSGYQSTPAPFKPQRSSSSSENNNGGNKTLQSTIYFGSDDSYSESDGVLSPDESGGGVGSRFVDIQASYDEYSDSPLQVMSAGSSGSQSTSVLDLYGDSEWEEVASQIPRINTLPVIDEVTESEDNNDDDDKMTSQIYDYSPSHVSDDNDSDHSSSVTTSPRVDNDVINQETASNSGSDVTATCEDSLEDEASTAKSSRAGSLLEDNSSAQDQSPVEHFHAANVEISHDSEVDANIPETSNSDVTLPEVSEQVENSKSQDPEEADVMMSIPDVVSDQLTGTTEENKTSENELDGGQENDMMTSSEDQEVDEPISSEVTQQLSDEPTDIVTHSRKSSSSSSSSSSSGDEDQVIFDDEEEGTEEVGFKQETNEINNQETPDQNYNDETFEQQQESVEIKQADLYDDEKVEELYEHHQENQNTDDDVSTSGNLVDNFEEANSQDIFSDKSESNPIETSLISDGLLDLGGVEHHEDQDTINKETLEQGEFDKDTYQEQDNIFAEDNQASNTNVETVDVLSSFEEIKSDDIFSDNSESAQLETLNQTTDIGGGLLGADSKEHQEEPHANINNSLEQEEFDKEDHETKHDEMLAQGDDEQGFNFEQDNKITNNSIDETADILSSFDEVKSEDQNQEEVEEGDLVEEHNKIINTDDKTVEIIDNLDEANSPDIFSDNSESIPIETSNQTMISDGLLDLGGVEHQEDQDTINKETLEQGEFDEDTYQEQDNIFAEDNQASNTNVETVDVLSSFEEIKSDDIFSDNSESAQPNENANQSLGGLLDLTGSTTSNDTNQIFSDASNTEHDSNEVNTGETQNVETSNDFMGMFGDESTNATTTETNLLNDESPNLNMMGMDSSIDGGLLDVEPQLDTLVHGLVTEVLDEALTSTQLLGEEPTLMVDTNDDGLIVVAQEVVTEVVDHVLNNNLVGLETNQESDIFDAAHVQPQSTSMDDAFFTGDQEASVDEASVDGASVDGASVDGASVDGASVDEASVDGAKTTQRKSVRFISEGENIFDVSDDHEPQPEASMDSNNLLNVNEIEADAVQDSDSSSSSSEESNEGISQQQLDDQLINDQANNVDTKEQVVIVLNDEDVDKSGEEEETASEISSTDQQMISNLHNNNIISSGQLNPTTPLNTPLQSDGTLDEIFDNTDDQQHLPIVAPRRKKKPTMEQTAPLSGDGFAEDIFAADDDVKETKVEDFVESRHHESGLLNEDNDVQTWNTQQEEEKAANVEDENIFKMEDVDSNSSSSSSSSSDNSEHSDQLMEDLSEENDKETNISQVHISDDNIFDPEISDNLTTGQNDIHKEANILETDEISEEPVSIPGVDDIFTDSQNEENVEISNDFINSNLMSELEPQQQEPSSNIADNIQVENDANIFQIDQQLATSLPEVQDPFNDSVSNPILDEEVKTSDDLMDSDQISGFTQDQEMSTDLTMGKIDNQNEENIFDLDGEVSEEPLTAALPEAQDLFNNSISNPILDEEVKLSDNLMDSDQIPGFTQDQELSSDVTTDKNEVEKDENIFQLDEVSEQQFTNSPPEVQDPFNDLAQVSQHEEEEEVEVSEEVKDSEQVVKEEKTNEVHPEQKETEEVKETTSKPPKATVSRVASLRRRITVDVMEEVKTSDDEDVTRRKGERERFDTIGSLELLTDDSDEESAGKPKQLIASKEDPIPDDPEPPSEDGTGVLVSLSDNDPPVPGGRLKKRKSLVPPSSLLLSVALDDIGAPAPSLSPATEEPPQSGEADPTVEAKEETENMDEDGVKNETMTVSTGTDVINTSSTTYVDKGSNLAQLQLPVNMDESNVIWDEVVINKETYKIDGGCLQPYKRLVCHGGFYKERCTIVEIFGQYLPDSSTPNYTWIMDNIFMYLLSTVQLLAGENKFAIVFFNTNVSRSAIPGSNLLKKFHSLVPYELRKKMESCYVIQPSFTLKTTIRFSRFLSRKAIQKIVYVKSYPELKSYLPTEFLYIPDDILGSQK